MKRSKAIRKINEYFDSLHSITWCGHEIAKERGRENAINTLLPLLEHMGVVKPEELVPLRLTGAQRDIQRVTWSDIGADKTVMSAYCIKATEEDSRHSLEKGVIRHMHCPGHDEHGNDCECQCHE